MRCTAPMKAPSPPPTMPSRIRFTSLCSRPSIAMGLLCSLEDRVQPEHASVGSRVGAGRGEVVEGGLSHSDDVVADESRAFACPILGVFQAALPLQHGPGVIVVLGELRENRVEGDLPVAEGAKPAGALDPAFIAAVNTDAGRRIELGILDVKRLDALVIEIDEGAIVELLQ